MNQPVFVSAVFAAEKPVKKMDNYIAVFDFETTGKIDKDISRPLTESIRRELVLSGKYEVIDRGNMNKILGEQKFQMSGCVSGQCIVEAGQLLGVGKIIAGSVSIVGKTYYLSLSLINVTTGKIENVSEDKCKCEVDELIDSSKRLIKKLMGEQVTDGVAPQQAAKPDEPAIKEEPKVYAEPVKALKVYLHLNNDRRDTMTFTGFNTKCDGYKDEGIIYTEGGVTITIPWKDINYIIPGSGYVKLANSKDFKSGALLSDACKKGYILETRRKKVEVLGYEKVIDEEAKAPLNEIMVMAFSEKGLEEGIDKIDEKRKSDEAIINSMEFVFVKGGCYQMGCGSWTSDCYDSEEPVHEVCVDDFYIGKYEVTQGQWQAVMGNNLSHFKNCGNNCPVESVSWNDAQEFIQKLNEKIPLNRGDNPLLFPLNKGGNRGLYRLPTEAEWEYAARSGGRSEKYAGGDDIDRVAWYDGNSGSKTHPVGQKVANGLGIYDMSGNVWEWVQDWYDDNYYRNSPRNNPQGPNSGSYRVLRGGSWLIFARNTRAAFRYGYPPVTRHDIGGFRLVRTPVK